ncbi:MULTISPECIES: DUF732 domain-containing protein [unclassified Microbacterium]|uniref:DUF732 domain-containing protein n=1 Tax=unclassified Microbacterium TaxID=2609290 RepID=UPI0016051509|nr:MULTISPECIES: DUF732 domain-containing protein [unclassified Microbacterium]QNA93269.1 DUF732 domain-containing protein [Microbacterium sp. Se63.02b]QYM63478.1 DUF732 domain-containing protein [Microbacterium sp. Se5.02b]
MKTRIALVSAVLLLSLTGCAGAPGGSSDAAPEPSQSDAPLAAETPTQAPSESSTASEADEKFLAYVREELLAETQIPDATDEQLIAAGHEACEQLESGVAMEDVRVVEGEDPHPTTGVYYDSVAIRGAAQKTYCTDAG